MLKINVDQLRDGPQTFAFNLDPQDLELSDEFFKFEGKVKGEIEFNLANHDVDAHGDLRARAVTQCARCLEPARIQLDVPIHEVWLKRTAEDPQTEELTNEDILAEYYDGEEIHLKEPLRELILAELPDIVHCRPDCKGLCPGCGANLNKERCRCKRVEEESVAAPEPEWKKTLRGLRNK